MARAARDERDTRFDKLHEPVDMPTLIAWANELDAMKSRMGQIRAKCEHSDDAPMCTGDIWATMCKVQEVITIINASIGVLTRRMAKDVIA